MIDSVPNGIQGDGKAKYLMSVDFVVEVEEEPEASACEEGLCGFKENVIAGKTFPHRESLRGQVLLVSELYYCT